MPISVSQICYYPIKSCRGISVHSAEIRSTGIKNDRRMMLVDDQGIFLTQRKFPKMALISPAYQDQVLRLTAPGMELFTHDTDKKSNERSVKVWNDRLFAIDQGDEIAGWLSDYLGINCRLVQMSERHPRPVNPKYAVRQDNLVSFADGFPFLLTTESSLTDLNTRLPEPIDMDRFRPNIVLAGTEPYDEDNWKSLQIGALDFKVAKPCERCVITTIDQGSAERGREPLRTLATYRLNEKNNVEFGQNLIHLQQGIISVGDPAVPKF